ncbi:MAG TPA: tubulin-like doman-containing protein, partial [Thermoanaerobaculia bacterium]|nr:tubulin-like doman-containing protein [Thermoanaerobaculia bacterium]
MVETSVMTRRIIGGVSEAEEADYTKRLEEEARRRERGIYPRTIFIALGGTGAKALMHLRRMVIERFGGLDSLEGVAYLSIDTDVRSQEPSAEEEKKSPLDKAISFSKDERINVKVDFKNYVGPNLIHHPQIREWWDEAALPNTEFNLEIGAGQIRQLSRLAFFTNRDEIQEGIGRAYRKVTSISIEGSRVDTASKVRVVVVAGLAGGTGSGMLFDLAAQLQDQLGHHELPSLEAFLVLPGGFSTVEQGKNYPKVAANGFAALKELNHYLVHPFSVRWQAQSLPIEVLGLFERYVLFSGTNASN